MKKIIFILLLSLISFFLVHSASAAELTEEDYPGPFISSTNHEKVPEIKEWLMILGYGSFSKTDLYGPITASSVESFQSDFGLDTDGILKYEGYTLLKSEATGHLRNPMYREDAIDVKQKISKAGFGDFSYTTYFGPQTEQAIKDFQAYYGLNQNGEVDENTIQMLNTVADSPYQNGENHEKTPEIKKWLTTLGYGFFSNTTYYGPQTEGRVMSFQEDHQLRVNGIVDPVTKALLKKEAESDLHNPMYRDDVVPLKEDLQKMGFGSFSNTTYFGPQTEETVKEVQKYYGLSVDGVVGETTRNKISEVVNSPFQNGGYHDETAQLKNKLQILGYDFFSDTRYFGPRTEKALMEFQSDFSLKVNGIGDSRTWDKLKVEANGPLKNPMYRDDVVELKQNLTSFGFGSFSNTNYYGPQTEETIKEFQKYYGLEESGVFDSSTSSEFEKLNSYHLSKGEQHEDTVKVKKWLYTLGYGSFNFTKTYGSLTAEKVTEFQNDHNLPPSGIAEKNTFTKLEDEANRPLRKGMYRDDVIDLKDYLTFLGYGEFQQDNDYFGSSTESALKKVQSDYDVEATGIFDDETMDLVMRLLENPDIGPDDYYRTASIENGEIKAVSTLFDSYDEAYDQLNDHTTIILLGSEVVHMKDGIVRFNQPGGLVYIHSNSSFSNSMTYVTNSSLFASEAVYSDASEEFVVVNFGNRTGYVRHNQVDLVPMGIKNFNNNRNYYEVNSRGDLIHRLYNASSGSFTLYTFGQAPSELSQGEKYYSTDGKKFYDSSGRLVADKAQYFNNLPVKTESNYSADDLNHYIDHALAGRSSKLKDTGQYFVDAQERTGINALFMLGAAIHESAFGTSKIAMDHNNLFGLNATDENPYGQANQYYSVEDNIRDFSENWIRDGYAHNSDWRFEGAIPGNKSIGFNVRYASDMNWGQKIAGHMYRIDNFSGNKDINNYEIYETTAKVNARTGPGTSYSVAFTYDDRSMPVAKLGGNTTWYKVSSDHRDHRSLYLHNNFLRKINIVNKR